jgi:hypothetical protein
MRPTAAFVQALYRMALLIRSTTQVAKVVRQPQ